MPTTLLLSGVSPYTVKPSVLGGIGKVSAWPVATVPKSASCRCSSLPAHGSPLDDVVVVVEVDVDVEVDVVVDVAVVVVVVAVLVDVPDVVVVDAVVVLALVVVAPSPLEVTLPPHDHQAMAPRPPTAACLAERLSKATTLRTRGAARKASDGIRSCCHECARAAPLN